MKKKIGRCILRDELARLSFINSPRLPKIINDRGIRKEWVGIGWLEGGKLTGRETLVIEESPMDKEEEY